MSRMKVIPLLNELDTLDRRRAETLYALFILHARLGDKRVAKGYAEECIEILRCLGSDTYEECVTDVTSIGGVTLPDFLHEDMVRAQLRFFGVEAAPKF